MQRELIGRGQSSAISNELSRLGAQRVLLVTGKESYSKCGAKRVMEPLLSDYVTVIYNDFSPNPRFSEAMAGVRLYNKENCDVIVAIGGGSTIDIAKSINALQAHPGQEREIAIANNKLSNPLAPFIAVPTTAGTGSEATHFAVIYVDGKKYSIASANLIPDVAIIDPVYTDSLPPYITACTGFDALCQSIESYWAVGANEESKKYAALAIGLIIEYLPTAVNLGGAEARNNIMSAANLAGKAINISKTTAPHALSYVITSEFGLAHGHAVALTLGEFFVLHSKVTEAQLNSNDGLSQFSQTMQELFALLKVNNAREAKNKWYGMMQGCGLETGLTNNGIRTEGDIDKIIEGVNLERLSNHPVKLTVEMMKDIFKQLASVSTAESF